MKPTRRTCPIPRPARDDRSGAQYDPATFAITGAETAYELFHELAHLEQHSRGTWLFRLRTAFVNRRGLRWTGLGGLVDLAVEIEALLMARAEMKLCGLWEKSDRREAWRGLAAYVAALFARF